MSSLSKSACSAYDTIDAALKTDDMQKRAVCVLSLANPAEIAGYFEWIAIPTGQKSVSLMYSTASYAEYVDMSVSRYIIKDPNRIFENLVFMNTRLNRLLTMRSDLQRIKSIDITPVFKKRIADSIFKRVDVGSHAMPLEDAKDLGLLVNLHLLDDLRMLHRNFQSPADAVAFMRGKAVPKQYLVRTSTYGNNGGDGDCTVFTVSFVTDSNDVFHIRLLDMHGVGIYVVTDDPRRRLIKFDLNYADLLKKSNMKEILSHISFAPPQYACIIDCLLDLEKIGYIDIGGIVAVD